MLLATLVIYCCATLQSDVSRASDDSMTGVVSSTEKPAVAKSTESPLPDAPMPKSESAVDTNTVSSAPSGSISAVTHPFLNTTVKPAARGTYETARQRKIWYGLMAAGHSAAVFDAYTTRRAVSGGYGTESDPLMRPFAHSNAMYFATQVGPAIMDYLGHRMMTSNHDWMRRAWWVPQVAGTSLSLSAGIHNYRIAP